MRLAHFARWLVFAGRLSDGETAADLATERKALHQFSGRRFPSDWTGLDAWAFEHRALVAPNLAPEHRWPA